MDKRCPVLDNQGMKLPPPTTAPSAISAICRIIRAGVTYSCGEQAATAGKHWTSELRRLFDETPPQEIGVTVHRVVRRRPLEPDPRSLRRAPRNGSVEGGQVERLVMRPRRTSRLLFPVPAEAQLPPSWSACTYEALAWPPREPLPDSHPFRLCLALARGQQTLIVPIHDAREPWRGPVFEGRLPPLPFRQPFPEFLGYISIDDKLSDETLCQWMTIHLAQRGLLTDAEEQSAFETFFMKGKSEFHLARWKAYERTKRRFVQPLRGLPGSFGTYYRRAARCLEWELAETDFAGDVELGVNAGLQMPLPSDFVALRDLRRYEPQLHRAILDRVHKGVIEIIAWDGLKGIRRSDADAIDEERRRNAAARERKRPVEERERWLERMVGQGQKRDSARRKLQRWINTDGLTDEEIEARIASLHCH